MLILAINVHISTLLQVFKIVWMGLKMGGWGTLFSFDTAQQKSSLPRMLKETRVHCIRNRVNSGHCQTHNGQCSPWSTALFKTWCRG